MPGAQQSIHVAVDPETFFGVITDYEAYPEVLPDMEFAEIVARDGGVTTARFTINLIKRVSYTLRLVERPHEGLSWSLVEGPFKVNSGSWSLERLDDGSTLAHYAVEVKVGVFVPGSITNRLVGKTLPALLEAFKQRAESLV
jgi:coenzyme Q-binding protein COQ10